MALVFVIFSSVCIGVFYTCTAVVTRSVKIIGEFWRWFLGYFCALLCAGYRGCTVVVVWSRQLSRGQQRGPWGFLGEKGAVLAFNRQLEGTEGEGNLSRVSIFGTVNLSGGDLSECRGNRSAPAPRALRGLVELCSVSNRCILNLARIVKASRSNRAASSTSNGLVRVVSRGSSTHGLSDFVTDSPSGFRMITGVTHGLLGSNCARLGRSTS